MGVLSLMHDANACIRGVSMRTGVTEQSCHRVTHSGNSKKLIILAKLQPTSGFDPCRKSPEATRCFTSTQFGTNQVSGRDVWLIAGLNDGSAKCERGFGVTPVHFLPNQRV